MPYVYGERGFFHTSRMLLYMLANRMMQYKSFVDSSKVSLFSVSAGECRVPVLKKNTQVRCIYRITESKAIIITSLILHFQKNKNVSKANLSGSIFHVLGYCVRVFEYHVVTSRQKNASLIKRRCKLSLCILGKMNDYIFVASLFWIFVYKIIFMIFF